jgi:CRISPR-associated protein Csd1
LVDNLGVVCLFTEDSQNNHKLLAKHDFFVRLLAQASDAVPNLAPVAKALRNNITLETIRNRLTECKAKPADWVTLGVEDASGPHIFVEHNDWHAWWHAFRTNLADRRKTKKAPKQRGKKGEHTVARLPLMRCLLSGELVEPMSTHNTIDGLSDFGGRAKCMLVSFDKDAFSSYGLKQGANAAMSETMVKTYVTALNDLIRHHSRRFRYA